MFWVVMKRKMALPAFILLMGVRYALSLIFVCKSVSIRLMLVMARMCGVAEQLNVPKTWDLITPNYLRHEGKPL